MIEILLVGLDLTILLLIMRSIGKQQREIDKLVNDVNVLIKDPTTYDGLMANKKKAQYDNE